MVLVDAKPISLRIRPVLLSMGIPLSKIKSNDFAWMLKHLDRNHPLFDYVWPILIREYNRKGN